MKKIINALFICSIFALFTSCIIVTPDIRYSITFKNDTFYNINDWYVENDDGKNFTKSDKYVPVYAYSQSTIYDLWPDMYRVRFSYHNDYYYIKSNYTFLDEDIVYILSYDNFYSRSASTSDSETLESVLVLKDNKGNVYKLEKN